VIDKPGVHVALEGRMTQTLKDTERIVQRADLLLSKMRHTGDDGFLDGVALNLHSFYTGIESIFEDIGRTVDGALPAGQNWHKEMLQQMSAELVGVRPAVIRRSTRDCLDEYRAFRHLVRNVYTFNLRPARLFGLADGVLACFTAVREDLEEFCSFLRTLDEA